MLAMIDKPGEKFNKYLILILLLLVGLGIGIVWLICSESNPDPPSQFSGTPNIQLGMSPKFVLPKIRLLLGYQACYAQTTGYHNLFQAYQAGYAQTTGRHNLLLGYQAGDNMTSGNYNIIIGTDYDTPSATGKK
jgi:hypothetical protein